MADKEKSTVFSDPKRAREEAAINAKKRKKTVLIIIALLLVVFIVIPIIIVGASKLAKSAADDTPTYTERLEKTKADAVATEISEMTSALDGDAEKALRKIKIEQDYGEFSVIADLEQKRVTVVFENKQDGSTEEQLQNSVVAYSCLLLAAFDDIDSVGWEYSLDSEKKEGYFTREDAGKLLGNGISRFSEANGIQLIMNIFGLND